MVDTLAAEFVERLYALGERCDIATDIVFWYPLRVAMTVLGIDAADEARMLKLTHELFGAPSDPAVRRPGMSIAEHLIAVKRDYIAFFEEITTDRRAHPRDDVATIIAQGLPDARDLTPEERIGYYVIIAAAGHDTTAASIVGGIAALIEDPALIDQAARRSRARQDLRQRSDPLHRAGEAFLPHRDTGLHAGRHDLPRGRPCDAELRRRDA
ncbi:hypothetical protein AB5I41_11140 [Sphingomonas sp. MMS24-JH45]